jgi:hypothetical protein
MIGRNDYIGRTIESNPPKLPDDSEPKRVVTPERVAQYAKAEASTIVEGKVSLPVYDARKAACVGCDARVLSNKLPDELGYCRACGCGVSERSRLTVKLWMPSATCPRDMWKPAAGRRWERLKAMSETMVSLLDMRRWLG